MASESPTLVTVPLERLRALEALEASLPEVIAKAKAERDKERLTAFNASRDAKEHSKKQLEKYHKNKEEINARRREAYKAKKEAAANPAPA
jgi:hypothetical protein